jgi:hypothetical protein
VKRVGLFLAGSVLFWGVAAYPAYLLGGETGLLQSTVAAGLCLVAGLVTIFWSEWAFRRSPEQYLLMVLGGTGVRLFGVLGAALALQMNVPVFRATGFLLWLGVFYLASLALEILLMLAGRTQTGRAAANDQSGSLEQS